MLDSNGQNGNGKRSVSEDREGKPTSNRQRVDGTENLDIVKMNQIIIHNFVIVNFKFNSRNDTTTFKQNLLRLQRDYSDFESVLVRIDGHQCIVQCCYCQPADFITQNTTNSDRALSIVKHHLDHICHCVNEAWCLKVTRSGGDALRRKDEVIVRPLTKEPLFLFRDLSLRRLRYAERLVLPTTGGYYWASFARHVRQPSLLISRSSVA